MITKFVGKAPIDTLWVSDSWLPEWAEAGWIVPVDQYKTLVDNSDVDQFCVDSMTYKGKQYGNTYYSDYMAFIYNADMLRQGWHSRRRPPPGRRCVDQAKIIKDKGLAQWPVLISMAQETWLIEFMTAMVFSTAAASPTTRATRLCRIRANGAGSRAALAGRRGAEAQDAVRRPASRPVNSRCSRLFARASMPSA